MITVSASWGGPNRRRRHPRSAGSAPPLTPDIDVGKSDTVAVCQVLLGALWASVAIQNISVEGDTALSRAIHALPQSALVKDDSWQVGDDIMPANNPSKRGQFDPAETTISDYLKSQGHVVMPIYAQGQGTGTTNRNPDSLVDGQPIEFKTLAPAAIPKTIIDQLANSEKGALRSFLVKTTTMCCSSAIRGI